MSWSQRVLVCARLWLLVAVFSMFLAGYFPSSPATAAGDTAASSQEPPPAWRRQVGHLVIIVIDALRADFVLDTDPPAAAGYKIEYLQQLLRGRGEGGARGFVTRASPPTVTLPRVKVRRCTWSLEFVTVTRQADRRGADDVMTRVFQAIVTGSVSGFIDVVRNFDTTELGDVTFYECMHYFY